MKRPSAPEHELPDQRPQWTPFGGRGMDLWCRRAQRRRVGRFHGPLTGARTGRVLGIAVAGVIPAGITGRGPDGGAGC